VRPDLKGWRIDILKIGLQLRCEAVVIHMRPDAEDRGDDDDSSKRLRPVERVFKRSEGEV
jgi:hypothetical protein